MAFHLTNCMINEQQYSERKGFITHYFLVSDISGIIEVHPPPDVELIFVNYTTNHSAIGGTESIRDGCAIEDDSKWELDPGPNPMSGRIWMFYRAG